MSSFHPHKGTEKVSKLRTLTQLGIKPGSQFWLFGFKAHALKSIGSPTFLGEDTRSLTLDQPNQRVSSRIWTGTSQGPPQLPKTQKEKVPSLAYFYPSCFLHDRHLHHHQQLVKSDGVSVLCQVLWIQKGKRDHHSALGNYGGDGHLSKQADKSQTASGKNQKEEQWEPRWAGTHFALIHSIMPLFLSH